MNRNELLCLSSLCLEQQVTLLLRKCREVDVEKAIYEVLDGP